MARITIFTENILEDATVTITGSADTGFPKARLYDREVSLFWKKTGTEALVFNANYGSGVEVDFLAVSKHNFSGEDLTWDYSGDNFTGETEAAGWTQNDNDQIIKTLSTSQTQQYWRLTVTSMTDPKCSEIFMAKGLELNVRFDDHPLAKDKPNVLWNETIGGLDRSTKLGDDRKVRKYAILLDQNSSEITNFRVAMASLDNYSKKFYIKDHEGNYWMCRLMEQPQEEFITEGHVLLNFVVIEQL